MTGLGIGIGKAIFRAHSTDEEPHCQVVEMFQSFRQQGQGVPDRARWPRRWEKLAKNDVFQMVELVFDGFVDFIVAG